MFIIPTNHSTINSTTVSDAIFLAGTTNFSYGHVRAKPGVSHPQTLNWQAAHAMPSISGPTNVGDGFRDSTMLSYWGSVIVEQNTTGFAMEFIGDMNDSKTVAGSWLSWQGEGFVMGAGPNLQ